VSGADPSLFESENERRRFEGNFAREQAVNLTLRRVVSDMRDSFSRRFTPTAGGRAAPVESGQPMS